MYRIFYLLLVLFFTVSCNAATDKLEGYYHDSDSYIRIEKNGANYLIIFYGTETTRHAFFDIKAKGNLLTSDSNMDFEYKNGDLYLFGNNFDGERVVNRIYKKVSVSEVQANVKDFKMPIKKNITLSDKYIGYWGVKNNTDLNYFGLVRIAKDEHNQYQIMKYGPPVFGYNINVNAYPIDIVENIISYTKSSEKIGSYREFTDTMGLFGFLSFSELDRISNEQAIDFINAKQNQLNGYKAQCDALQQEFDSKKASFNNDQERDKLIKELDAKKPDTNCYLKTSMLINR